jgi:hypothetical protein
MIAVDQKKVINVGYKPVLINEITITEDNNSFSIIYTNKKERNRLYKILKKYNIRFKKYHK